MAIEIKVKFIVVSFENKTKHNNEQSEYEKAINNGWVVDNTYQFDFALVYEMKKYVVVNNE